MTPGDVDVESQVPFKRDVAFGGVLDPFCRRGSGPLIIPLPEREKTSISRHVRAAVIDRRELAWPDQPFRFEILLPTCIFEKHCSL